MFGLFKSKKSPLRQKLESQLYVFRTWYEWARADDTWVQTLVVEVGYKVDPDHPEFYRDSLDGIAAILKEFDAVDLPVRVIGCTGFEGNQTGVSRKAPRKSRLPTGTPWTRRMS